MTTARRLLDAAWSGIGRALPSGRPDGEPYPAARAALLWVLTRLLGLVVMVLAPGVTSDVNYYVAAQNPGTADVRPGLLEYPLPAVWLLALPDLVAQGDLSIYPWLFLLLMLATDAAFTVFLQRRGDGGAMRVWLAAGVLVGPLLWTRFDIVTGAAVAAALLVLARRPLVAGGLVAVAAVLKLWPVLLLPAFAAPRAGRARVALGAAAVVVVTTGLVLALEGPERLLTPLDYQRERGLQIESLPALPLMAAWALAKSPWDIFFSDFLALEVTGPGASVLLALSSVATLCVSALVVVIAVRLWRRTASPADVAWAVLSATCLLVMANKVFSPQYLIWLVPAAAAVVALDGGATARRCATALLAAGVLGQLIYPVLYVWIWTPSGSNILGTLLLALRLVPVLAVAVVATRQAWRRSAAPEPAVAA